MIAFTPCSPRSRTSRDQPSTAAFNDEPCRAIGPSDNGECISRFPHPPGILQREHVWPHLRTRTGWRTVVLAERRAMRHGAIAILAYRVSAEKPTGPVLKALCASTYLHDEDRWLRVSHQETTVT